jgi:hypothetical protein
MTDNDEEIDELREQTRGADRISADTNGGSGADGGEEEKKEEEKGEDAGDVEEMKDEQGEEEDDEDTSDGKTETEETPDETDAGGKPTPSDAFAEAFAERSERAKTGVDPRSVSADDPGLSAFLLALQDTGEIEEVGEAVRGAVGAQQPPEYDRDAVVRLALTYALSEEAPEYFDALVERS